MELQFAIIVEISIAYSEKTPLENLTNKTYWLYVGGLNVW